MVGSNKLTLLSDLDLLIALCSTQNDEAHYSEFVKRFLPTVKEECLKIGKRRNIDKHISIQIAHDTFEKVRKYKSFKNDGIDIPNSRNAILVYLFRIATNQFNDHYNSEKRKKENAHHKSYFDDLHLDSSIISPELLSHKKEIALSIFKKLTKNEQAVILADIQYKKHQRYLPDDVNAQLSEQLGVKKDSIRKIRERAIAKIKKMIDEINK